MNNTHDDFPHPVPPIAYLRWKENYFFIVLAPDSDVFGIAHFNSEPGFDRLRISVNFSIAGKPFRYSNEVPYPADFAMSKTVTDGPIVLTIEQSHKSFRLQIATDDLTGDLHFDGRLPSFDYGLCKYSAPELVPFKELMTLATNLPFEHLQQSMTVTGTISGGGASEIKVDGLGYRDHSWGMRSDNMVAEHTWCGLNFPDRAFGVMTIRTLVRPELEGKEGYVVDADGMRPLRSIMVEQVVEAEGALPSKVIHRLCDVYGREFTIESDVKGRYADVPLAAERPQGKAVYEVAETFCKSVLVETGDIGVSLIELGRNSTLGGIGQ